MAKLAPYLKSLKARGKVSFTVEEAMRDLQISRNAVLCGIYKLKKQGELVSPVKGWYVIVPPEHQQLGCLPPAELIPLLMQHLQLPYYVSLLSAALYHGASHQKPQVFQVITNKQLKPLHIGRVEIIFIYKKNISEFATQLFTVKTGYLTVATPEVTAVDLLLYPAQSGGLNHIITVLSELLEAIDPNKLIHLLDKIKNQALVQRLGYLIEQSDAWATEKKIKLVEEISNYLTLHHPRWVKLLPELPALQAAPRNGRWFLIENTTVESDDI